LGRYFGKLKLVIVLDGKSSATTSRSINSNNDQSLNETVLVEEPEKNPSIFKLKKNNIDKVDKPHK
jgi:hypothetical protein